MMSEYTITLEEESTINPCWFLIWRYGSMLVCGGDVPRTVVEDIVSDFVISFESNNWQSNEIENPGDLMRKCCEESLRQK